MEIESKWEIDCQLKCHISRSYVDKINRGGHNRIVESLGSDWRAKPGSIGAAKFDRLEGEEVLRGGL